MWRSIWQLPTSATLSPSLVSKIWRIASGAQRLAGGDELPATRHLKVGSGVRTQLCMNIIKYWTRFYQYSLLCANLNYSINQRNSSSLESHHAVRSCFWFPLIRQAAVSSKLCPAGHRWPWWGRHHAKTKWEGPQRGQMASPSQIYQEEPLEKTWVIIRPNIPPGVTSRIPLFHCEFLPNIVDK